ncbi:MAG: hypothetical protein ACK4ZJ_18530, partial [Allorhizobium sp.]
RSVNPRASVRGAFVRYALAFLIVGTPDVKRDALRTRGLLDNVVRGLPHDPPGEARHTLRVLHEHVLCCPTLSWRAKAAFFSPAHVDCIARLYRPADPPAAREGGKRKGKATGKRSGSAAASAATAAAAAAAAAAAGEAADDEAAAAGGDFAESTADATTAARHAAEGAKLRAAAHELLLALCDSPQQAVVVLHHAVRRLLGTLRPQEDTLQQELALRLLQKHP